MTTTPIDPGHPRQFFTRFGRISYIYKISCHVLRAVARVRAFLTCRRRTRNTAWCRTVSGGRPPDRGSGPLPGRVRSARGPCVQALGLRGICLLGWTEIPWARRVEDAMPDAPITAKPPCRRANCALRPLGGGCPMLPARVSAGVCRPTPRGRIAFWPHPPCSASSTPYGMELIHPRREGRSPA